MEIVVAIYCLMTFKIYAFCLRCHLYIYVSLYLHSSPSTHGISGQVVNEAGEKFEKYLKMAMELM